MNKDFSASLFVLLLFLGLFCLTNINVASAQDEIVVDGADFYSTSAIQYPEGVPAIDSTRTVLEYVDYIGIVGLSKPVGLTVDPVPRIIVEYADWTTQMEMQPPQDAPSFDLFRIVVEYADYAYTAGIASYIGPQATGLNDTEPPTIEALTRTPQGQVTDQDIVDVQVDISDSGSGVKNATLQYNLNSSAQWFSVPMTLDTTGFENSLSASFYAQIPKQPNATWVSFRVVSYDYAWNTASRDGDAPYSPYQVVPEFSSTMMLLVLSASSLLAAALARKQIIRRLRKDSCSPTAD